MKDRPHLRSLADRLDILPAYNDVHGELWVTKDDTKVALLAAMGFDASTETAAERALDHLDRREDQRLVAPVRVVTFQAGHAPTVQLTIPRRDTAPVEWHIDLREENGETHAASGCSSPREPAYAIEVSLPASPPPGYHALRAAVELDGRVVEDEQSFIISPGRCTALSKQVGGRREYGVWTNLYAVRSRRNWGVGDLTDLCELARGAARHGAAFVGLNPLHALENLGDRIGPYCPVSRLFRNYIYLDLAAVPEFAGCDEAQARLESPDSQAELARVRASQHVNYERVAALKANVLRLLHNAFKARHADRNTDRGRAYARYIEAQGKPLVDFATFLALQTRLSERGEVGRDWHDWPAEYRKPDTPEVDAFREAHHSEVEFHCFVQFELDRQLADAADEAGRAGMRLGLYHDLAIGSAADGSDAWASPDLHVRGVKVGAPPDPYSDTGQTWGFPPVDPGRLRLNRYDYWIRLLQNAMAHAGMLRIDHVMGLFRQFWVPDGFPGSAGAYVRYPAEDLLGILALESRRHGAVIVGEDLGTVPHEVPAILAAWGILSSRVMYFERSDEDGFHPAASYSPRALVTATNHDHPPLTGFFSGRDLEIRSEIGLIRSTEELETLRAERERSRAALLHRLIAEGLLLDVDAGCVEKVCAAAHAFLTRTPCPLIGISLDDLAGETDPVNLPGVGPDRYPSWSRKMRRDVQEILADPTVWAVLDEIRAKLDEPGAP